jgi:predicted GNAT family acetyltransferase
MEHRPATGNVRRDRERQVFELVMDDEVVGRAPYRQESEDVVVVPYVEVAPERRGHGLGAVLADGLLADIRSSGEQVVPTCGWLAGHMRENPRHDDLLAPRR